MGKRKEAKILTLLIILLLAINYQFFDDKVENIFSNYQIAEVQRVIDGDTIEIENSTNVRLLGINTPEKKELYYEEAKQFLEDRVDKKQVKLEFSKEKYDMYKRILAYVHINDSNVNLEIIRNGYANFYFPSGRDKYYNDFKNAWIECVNNNINLCEKSEDECANCIKLKEFDNENEIIKLSNKCYLSCNLTKWSIKDEGRKRFSFPKYELGALEDVEIRVANKTNTNKVLYWKGEDYVWTKTGDTLFLRDSKGKLVLWSSY